MLHAIPISPWPGSKAICSADSTTRQRGKRRPETTNRSGRLSATGLLKQMRKDLELEAVSLEWVVMGSLMAYYPANHLLLSVQHP